MIHVGGALGYQISSLSTFFKRQPEVRSVRVIPPLSTTFSKIGYHSLSKHHIVCFCWSLRRYVVKFLFFECRGLPDLILLAWGVTFGSPIGGLLYSVEEGSSFWSGPLSALVFFCIGTALFIFNCFRNGLQTPAEDWGYWSRPGKRPLQFYI